jgi:hypothetical protein
VKRREFPCIPLGVSDPRALPSYAVQYAVRQLTAVDMQRMALYGHNPRLVCGFTATIPIWKPGVSGNKVAFPTRACPPSRSFQPLE